VKKEQNGTKSLRRLKPTVGCNASKRRRQLCLFLLLKYLKMCPQLVETSLQFKINSYGKIIRDKMGERNQSGTRLISRNVPENPGRMVTFN